MGSILSSRGKQWSIGDLVDARDTSGVWLSAKVTSLDLSDKKVSVLCVDGQHIDLNVALSADRKRLAPHGEHSKDVGDNNSSSGAPHDNHAEDSPSSYSKGDRVDVRQKTGVWRVATVRKVSSKKIKVQVMDNPAFWVDLGEAAERLAPHGRHTAEEDDEVAVTDLDDGPESNQNDEENEPSESHHSTSTKQKPSGTRVSPSHHGSPPPRRKNEDLTVGTKVLAQDFYVDKATGEPSFTWRRARVVACDGTRVQVHYTGWKSKWDEWIDLAMEENRVRLEDTDGSVGIPQGGVGRRQRAPAGTAGGVVAAAGLGVPGVSSAAGTARVAATGALADSAAPVPVADGGAGSGAASTWRAAYSPPGTVSTPSPHATAGGGPLGSATTEAPTAGSGPTSASPDPAATADPAAEAAMSDANWGEAANGGDDDYWAGVETGQRLEVLDYYVSNTTHARESKWRSAEVVTRRVAADGGTELRIHFAGYKAKWDTWIHTVNGAHRFRWGKYPILESNALGTSATNSGLITASSGERGWVGENTASGTAAASYVVPAPGEEEWEVAERRRALALTQVDTSWSVGADGSPTGLVGLRNLGNTCFMNSCLQCLSNIPELTSYFLSGAYRRDISRKGPAKGRLATSFAELLTSLWAPDDGYGRDRWAGRGRAVAPSAVAAAIGTIAARFKGGAQHDAQELLRCLLDGLHEDLNRIRRWPAYEEIKDREGESDQEKSRKWWKNYVERNDSQIKDVFCGQLRSWVTCRTCKFRSSCFDPFWDLSLPIPKQRGSCTIDDCLRAFVASETLSGDEKYYCPRCRNHRTSNKQMAVYRTPRVLVLHLKRFAHSRARRRKLTTSVTFPHKKLDIRPFCATQGDPVLYDLVGVSNHMGSLAGGHYTADCLNIGSHQWYDFNDSTVTGTSVRSLSAANAYLLFYQRRK